MARPRTFDEGYALDAAMRLFWEKGYEATSTQDLCEVTGLGRSSIYNTFTSKHALFLRSLERYVDMVTRDQHALLDGAELSAVDRLRSMFTSVIDMEERHRRKGRGIGCLGVNSSTELAGRDPEVAQLLGRDLERRLSVMGEVIAQGQRAGEISRARKPDELARFLNAVIAGIRVSAQNGADRSALEGVAACAMDSLTR
ncbi:TetR/AcrR family transcriptional regulator [Streptomyces triticagri]|uniref:TetR/AcrR family transcriptional regulator n=1 Tax=Streptomyces triticagri TaxID=2293568 RepID=A0A372M1F2_9ACTN|nr:TetR/AcrR family transcriptional regulator [Streptomyces triticagri]RFU84117.1 TetR/AcrR family transcriptional regulator [Streptomyces triticagri]